MLSVRIHAKGDVRLDEVTEPAAAPETVILTGGYTGICGSDLHLYFAPEAMHWDFTSPAPLTGARWPQILGHEFSGEVAAVGEGVDAVRTGDRVAVFPYHTCGSCPPCRAGRYTLCWQIAFEGIQGRSGGMATHKIVPAENCFVLPDGVDLRLGALVEPMAVAWHGVELAGVEPGEAALVLGGGPIGVGAYFALRAGGVSRVVVSEPSPHRRQLLARIGVEHVVDPISQDLVEYCRALTDGAGVAATVDCAGAPRAFAEGLSSLAFGGRMVIVAAYEEPVELPVTLLAGDRSIRSSAVYTREDFAAVIAAMDRGVHRMDGGWVEPVEFEDVVDALHELRAGKRMKVLVRTP